MSNNSKNQAKCPVHSPGVSSIGTKIEEWWPNRLKLNILRQNSSLSNPMDKDFDYKKAFNSLEYKALKTDLKK